MSAPRFLSTYCSQCGGEFGPGDSGYSNCYQHTHNHQGAHMVCAYCGDPMVCHDNDQPVCCCGELHFVSDPEQVEEEHERSANDHQ